MPRLALYPGTFDPITNGHVDVLERALRIFDVVEIAVGVNADKRTLLDLDERLQLIRTCTADLSGVTVGSFEGLVVDYARARGAVALIRGVRQGGDLEYEMRMYFANRRLHPDLDTVFFAPSAEHALVSASIVREIHRWGGDVRSFVPRAVADALQARPNSR
jgi:pantetheine-phosphate adenylyltransferase